MEPVSPEIEAEALRIWNEYAMTLAGISYQSLGYHTGDGITLPAWKIDEHMVVHRYYHEAQEERRRS